MFKRIYFSSVPLMSLALIGCSSEVSQEAHSQALRKTREAWGQAIAAGDLAKIFSFWTDDVVIYPASEPVVRGLAEVQEYVRRNRQERALIPRTEPQQIVASKSGDLGYIIGKYTWINNRGEEVMPGHYVSMWRKNESGEWKCFLEIHSPLPDGG